MKTHARRLVTSLVLVTVLTVFTVPSFAGTAKAYASINPWALPAGYPWGWTNTDPGDYYGNRAATSYYFGTCTWGAAYLARHNAYGLGNAMDWTYNAVWHGLPTGTYPVVNATVVFSPYNQGAGYLGHVAQVVQVIDGYWFVVREMNFWWNGGGWNRWDYRYAHAGWGVTFIYATY